jgi:hypothetical protein
MAALIPRDDSNILQIDLDFQGLLRDAVASHSLKRGDIIYEKSLGIHVQYVGNGDYLILNRN